MRLFFSTISFCSFRQRCRPGLSGSFCCPDFLRLLCLSGFFRRPLLLILFHADVHADEKQDHAKASVHPESQRDADQDDQ